MNIRLLYVLLIFIFISNIYSLTFSKIIDEFYKIDIESSYHSIQNEVQNNEIKQLSNIYKPDIKIENSYKNGFMYSHSNEPFANSLDSLNHSAEIDVSVIQKTQYGGEFIFDTVLSLYINNIDSTSFNGKMGVTYSQTISTLYNSYKRSLNRYKTILNEVKQNERKLSKDSVIQYIVEKSIKYGYAIKKLELTKLEIERLSSIINANLYSDKKLETEKSLILQEAFKKEKAFYEAQISKYENLCEIFSFSAFSVYEIVLNQLINLEFNFEIPKNIYSYMDVEQHKTIINSYNSYFNLLPKIYSSMSIEPVSILSYEDKNAGEELLSLFETGRVTQAQLSLYFTIPQVNISKLLLVKKQLSTQIEFADISHKKNIDIRQKLVEEISEKIEELEMNYLVVSKKIMAHTTYCAAIEQMDGKFSKIEYTAALIERKILELEEIEILNNTFELIKIYSNSANVPLSLIINSFVEM